jgi:hypothetical protein
MSRSASRSEQRDESDDRGDRQDAARQEHARGSAGERERQVHHHERGVAP